MKEFQILGQVAATASKKEKENILRENDSEVLRNICLYSYDPFRTYRVQQLEFPDKYNQVQPDISVELFLLLDLLSKHKTTPTEARGMIKRLMIKCTENGAMWVGRIINRDLKIGCGINTINKAFPGLIKEFKVALANPMVEFSKGIEHWDDVKYTAGADEKADGMRIVAICNGETVTFFSREGHEITTLDHLIPQILYLRPGTKFVLDGESIGIKYNPNCKTAKKNYEKGKNWKFAQGLSMTKSGKGTYPESEMKECLGLMVFDIIDYDYFLSQGELGPCKPFRHRRTELSGLFERLDKILPNVQLIPNIIVRNKAEAIAYFKKIVSAGGEGIVIKDLDALYEFKRSNAMIKLKEFYPADLRIIDCIEGKLGTKNEGSLGAILVGDDDMISGKLMGGWDDEEGLDIWLRHKRGEMVGKIVECIYKEITADNSLRHAVFVTERPDKSEISLG